MSAGGLARCHASDHDVTDDFVPVTVTVSLHVTQLKFKLDFSIEVDSELEPHRPERAGQDWQARVPA